MCIKSTKQYKRCSHTWPYRTLTRSISMFKANPLTLEADIVENTYIAVQQIEAICFYWMTRFQVAKTNVTKAQLEQALMPNHLKAVWQATSCMRSTLLHGSETWAPTVADLWRLCHNDKSMIPWICGVKLLGEVLSAVLQAKVECWRGVLSSMNSAT